MRHRKWATGGQDDIRRCRRLLFARAICFRSGEADTSARSQEAHRECVRPIARPAQRARAAGRPVPPARARSRFSVRRWRRETCVGETPRRSAIWD